LQPKILFSNFYGIDRNIIDEYGAFNISLISDLPLFIDPSLLFHSEKEEYKDLHLSIIKYLLFCTINRPLNTFLTISQKRGIIFVR
jgi:hypothetical protein